MITRLIFDAIRSRPDWAEGKALFCDVTARTVVLLNLGKSLDRLGGSEDMTFLEPGESGGLLLMSWESPPLDREGFGFNVILDKWLDAIGSRQFGSGSKVIQLDQRWRLGDTIRRMLLAGISCLSRMGLTLLGCATEVSQTVAPTVSYKIGGSVTEPAQGTFTYDAGMVVLT